MGCVEADGRINAADAWIAFAAEQDLLTLADSALPMSTANELLTASAAQGLLAGTDRVTYLHQNQIDSVLAITDSEGQLIEQSQRYPYGMMGESSTNREEPLGFTGLRSEGELVRAEARLYDPFLGRWMAPDPRFAELEDSGEMEVPWEAMGAYVYGWNTPVSGQDETGELWRPEYAGPLLVALRNSTIGSRSTFNLEFRVGAFASQFSAVADQAGAIRSNDTAVEAAGFAMGLLFQHENEVRTMFANDNAMLTFVDQIIFSQGARQNVMDRALKRDLHGFQGHGNFSTEGINHADVDPSADTQTQLASDNSQRLNAMQTSRATRNLLQRSRQLRQTLQNNLNNANAPPNNAAANNANANGANGGGNQARGNRGRIGFRRRAVPQGGGN